MSNRGDYPTDAKNLLPTNDTIHLLDCVKLKCDRPDIGVSRTDIGTVVDIANGESYTVEFVDENGYTNEPALFACFSACELKLVMRN